MLSFLQRKRNRRALALLLAAVLVLSPLSSMAGTYDIGSGDITVTATLEGEQNVQKVNGTQDDETIVITGNTTGNALTLNAGAGATVQVTVKDLHIDAIYVAVTATGGGDVVIELDGENTLTAGYKHAGLQKENGGTLTIQDANNDGSLTANGGRKGAGIGGGNGGDGTGITISGGTVTATGGVNGAGIGGGSWGNGTGITIEDGTVTATGGDGGAGIGGGDTGSGTDINITGGKVVATGGIRGAGIGAGGGTNAVGSDITISGGTVVAVSTEVGAGIGGGSSGTAGDITVSGDAQVSVAGGETYIHQHYTKGSGAGIGDGGKQNNDPAGDPIPGDEVTPNKEGLTCGQIDYYIAGTTAEQIQNGTVTPTKTVCGSGHAPGVPVKENEVAGNCTTDGGYDLVTRCQYCNTILSSEHTNTGIAHTPGEPRKENEIAGDCVTDGGYDLVTYCTACGDELSRQHFNTGKVADAHDWKAATCETPKTCSRCDATEGKALGHDLQQGEPDPAPTCTEPGRRLDRCKNCDYCETVVIPAKGHAEVVDPAKAPTCTATGLTEGKHCSACNTVLVAQEVVKAKGHTPGEPVKEKEVAPTEEAEGSYEAVVYCTVCGAELSREKKTVQKLSHVHTEVADEAVAPTCTETGLTAGKDCSACGEVLVAQEVVPAKGHTPGEAVREKEVAPQIGVAGSYDEVVYCTVCEAELSRTAKAIPALEPEPKPEPEPTPVVVDDPFTAFCKTLAYRIRTAPTNGVVEADGTTWPGLQRIVVDALAARPDVTLKLTCLVLGQPAELTVPAGKDLLTPLGNRDMLTFEEIVKILG